MRRLMESEGGGPHPEAGLIQAARRGDAASLALLLQQHYLVVKKYLITVTMDRVLAEDLTQETMVRAIQRIGQYEGRSKFSTWLIAIATNLYTDLLRRNQRERRLESEYARQGTVEPGSYPSGEWSEVMDRLAELPRDVALSVVLKHYYGYTYEEIAAWTDVPAGTVKSRVHHGVLALRKELTEDER